MTARAPKASKKNSYRQRESKKWSWCQRLCCVVRITRELAICPKVAATTRRWIHCLALSSPFTLFFSHFHWKKSFSGITKNTGSIVFPFTLSFSHFHRNKSLSAILQMVLETLSCSCFPFALFLSHGHGDRIVTYVTICLEFNLSLHKGFSAQNICQQNCFRYYSLQLTIYWALIFFCLIPELIDHGWHQICSMVSVIGFLLGLGII